MQEQQLSLNYAQIETVAGRPLLREMFTRTEKTAYQIPFEDIKIREGFNKRIVYDDIEELGQSIKSNGLIEPLTVDVLPDGTVYLERGHRRHRAFQLLIQQGEFIDFVDCYVNNQKVTEFDRMLNQYTSNNNQKKLKPIEAANVAFALKHNFGDISNEMVGEKMGVSRQTVDNLLILASSSDVIKNQIVIGKLNVSDALSLIGNEKKLRKQAEKDEVKHGQSSMYVVPDAKDVNAQELKDSSALEKQFPKEEDANDEGEKWEEVGEDQEKARMTNNVSGETKDDGKPLNLVGNSISENSKTAKDDDETVKYDMGRPEIAFVQNCIKLADKLEAITNRFDIPEGSKKDVADIVKWMQKDLAELRTWVHSNKKQNKIR